MKTKREFLTLSALTAGAGLPEPELGSRRDGGLQSLKRWVGQSLEVTHALPVIKPDRLCFGTDYLHEMSRVEDTVAYMNVIKSLKISDADKAKMMGGNILSLFKFQV